MRTRIITNSDGINIPVMFQTNKIQKADVSTSIDKNDNIGEYTQIAPEIIIKNLKDIAKESTIIPQCIKAYKTNIAGLGIEVKSKLDDKIDNPEENAEKNKLQNITDSMNYDKPIKEVIQELIGYREQCGIAYLEVIRNNMGEVVEIHALDPEFIIQTSHGPAIEFKQMINGKEITRRKRFRKFLQNVNGKEIWYKEFNFPGFMNYQNGNITDVDNVETEANEILVFKIGSELYGTPRWWGQSINCQGSKMAEYVNFNYFLEGRHTPVMIIVKGGTLSNKSWDDLTEYMNGIKGYKNSHGFLVLEVEALEKGTQSLGLEDDDGKKIDVEIKDMSPMLQKDALFVEYLKENEKGIQSSFNLPDIYVGKTSDYNRATSYSAKEVTEEQVFQPERDKLNWTLNNLLLANYNLKYVKAVLKAPKLSNTEDLTKIIEVLRKAGALTPLAAQKLVEKYADITLEEFTDDWSKIPVEVLKILKGTTNTATAGQELQKSERQVDILKDVRNVLIDLTDKYNLE